jgi:transcriptional/translational regulatory protein YebC/TACO1
MTFEAIFAPSMALIVEVETDNKIRALQDVREILKDWGAVQSSTKFLFSRLGRVVFAKGESGLDADSIMDDAIEAGAEDIRTDANSNIIIWTQPSLTSQVCEQLGGKLGLQVISSDIIWSPNKETETPIDPSANIFYFTRLLEALRDHPEVQAIYANVSKGGASDEDWAKIEDSLDACINAQTDSL